MENLLLPFIWLLMLLEWIYKKIRFLYYWIMGEPEPQRKRKGISEPYARPDATEPQGKTIEPPEQKPVKDDGMNPQERTLPRFTMEKPKPEPKRKPKRETPVIIFEPPKRPDKERRGMEM